MEILAHVFVLNECYPPPRQWGVYFAALNYCYTRLQKFTNLDYFGDS